MVQATYVQVTEPIPKFLEAGMTFHMEIKNLFIGSSFHCLPLKQILGHHNKTRKLPRQTI